MDATDESNELRFTIFAFLMAFATIAYWANVQFTWAVLPALLVMLKPTSLPRFFFYVLVQTALIYREMPFINTNITVNFFAGAAILSVWAWVFLAARGNRVTRSALLAGFAPLLRWEIVIVYFFTFWHKFNTGFLDPAQSCGGRLYSALAEWRLAWLPLPGVEDVIQPVIYGTLVLEALLPLILLLPATRKVSVVGAMGFHYVLGIAGFASFSATMCALLFLFAPDDVVAELKQLGREYGPRILPSRAVALALGAGAIAVGALFIFGGPRFEGVSLAFSRYYWLAAIFPIGVYALATYRSGMGRAERLPLAPLHWVFALWPLLVVVNGASPYLGLKTETAFAMYSNLRTEGGRSNHVIIRKPWTGPDYQTDLVEILESSNAWLQGSADERQPVPFFRLRRITAWALDGSTPDFSVSFIRDGVRRDVASAVAEADLAERPGYMENTLLNFRRIPPEDAPKCLH